MRSAMTSRARQRIGKRMERRLSRRELVANDSRLRRASSWIMREIGRFVQGQFFKFFSTSGLNRSWGKRIFWRGLGGTFLSCCEIFLVRHSAIGADAEPWGRTEFFGARPKKVPPVFSPPAPHPDAIELVAGRALFCKGRGEKDLEASAATRDFIPSAFCPVAASDFFCLHPKKVPP